MLHYTVPNTALGKKYLLKNDFKFHILLSTCFRNFAFDLLQKFEASLGWKSIPNSSDTQQRYNKYLTNLVFSVRTVSYGSSFFPLRFMARALRAWTINRRGKNSVRNLRYGRKRYVIIYKLKAWRERKGAIEIFREIFSTRMFPRNEKKLPTWSAEAFIKLISGF